MNRKVNKIKILQFAKLHAFIFAIIGLLAGIIYSFGGLVIDALVTMALITSNETPGLSMGTFLAFGALIGMPIISATFGFLLAVTEAIIYNIFTNLFKGVDIDY